MGKSPFDGARWIAIPGSEPLRIRTAYFRLRFEANAGDRLMLAISAHSRYRLTINGHSVTYGPCRGDRWRQYYETVDVGGYLRDGVNTVAVKVVAYPPYEAQKNDERAPFWTMARAIGPCLIVAGACEAGDGQKTEITTGIADWQGMEDTAISWRRQPISHWMGSMEAVSGAGLPHGWETGDDTNGNWMPVEEIFPAESAGDAMFGIIPVFPLTERPIPLMAERSVAFAGEMPLRRADCPAIHFNDQNVATVPPNSHMAVELDAGALMTAFLSYAFSGGKGSEVVFRYAESYSRTGGRHLEKGRRDDWEHYELNGHEDSYLPGGGEEEYRPFWFRTFRFLRIEVQTGVEPLTLHLPRMVDTGYPLEIRSRIEASESWVSTVWDMSVRTLEKCMQETYVDCPYYEQLQYLQDSRLEALFTYAVGGDTRMARRTIEDFHSSKLPDGMLQARYPSQEPHAIPAFAFQWIAMLLDYYWQTGDAELLTRYRSTVDGILEWFKARIGPTGLVERLGYWDQVDWVDQWSEIAGRTPASLVGASTAYNLMYAYALELSARINEITARDGMAAEYRARADAIRERVEALCWSEKEQLYTEGPGFEEYSQHTQVYAVLTGLKKDAEARALLDRAFAKEGIALCSFTWQFFVFRALEICGHYDRTETQWELWKGLLDKNLTTIPETPDGDTSPRSDCHAWSALPLYEFPRNFLGVNPTAPGWAGITVRPRTLSLTSCAGEAVTPKGIVCVQWRRAPENGAFAIKVDAPKGVPLTLIMPDGAEERFPQGGSVRRGDWSID